MVASDDMLECNQKELQFYERRLNLFAVFYLSQRYIKMPLVIRDNSDKNVLLRQTAQSVQKLLNVIVDFGKSYFETKELSRKAWK